MNSDFSNYTSFSELYPEINPKKLICDINSKIKKLN